MARRPGPSAEVLKLREMRDDLLVSVNIMAEREGETAAVKAERKKLDDIQGRLRLLERFTRAKPPSA